jgi:hypothetical protein
LTTIKLISQKKVELFEALLQDAEKFEVEDSQSGIEPNHPGGETSEARVTWGLRMIKSQHDCVNRLLLDLKQSMDAVSGCGSYADYRLTIFSFSNSDRLNKMNWPLYRILRTRPFLFSQASPSSFFRFHSSLLTTV